MTEPLQLGLLAGLGVVTGALNVVAGGGSFLTLPVLILLGLPATTANGTNRVGILAQNIGGVMGFHRYRVLGWRWALLASIPVILGAGLGTWAALVISDAAFRRLLALLMVPMSLWTLLAPTPDGEAAPQPRSLSTGLWLGFFVVGIYGGFVQAGMGFLLLALTRAAGLDLVRGNAVKVLCILLLTLLALPAFAWHDAVNWRLGLALGAGSLVGGGLGARLTVRRGNRFVRVVVSGAILVFAVLIWSR